MIAGKHILSTPELAAILGKSASTLWRRSSTDPKYRKCVLRRTAHSTEWSVQRLRDEGILTQEPQTVGG